jgi:hypothetical protein
VALAECFGPLESIFLSNICWWVETNRKNQKHYYEGRYWTYGSAEAFRKIFTYLSPQQIRRIIDTLREKKALLTGNFNRSGYDRTLWYTVSDEVMALYDPKNIKKDDQENPPPEPVPDEAGAGENPEPKSPDTGKEWENSPSHLSNSTNANGKNPIPMDRIQQMDLPDSIHRFAGFDPPIPLGKAVKSAAAPSPAKIRPQDTAAAPVSTGEKEEIRSLKAGFIRINPDLVFDDAFYHRALKVLIKIGPETDYPGWLYQECRNRNPKNLRALYYTLFCKPDMIALYQYRKAPGSAEERISCPACGKAHPPFLESCPFCGMGTADYGNPAAVEKQKRINAMPPDIRKRYNDELAQLYFSGMKLGMPDSLYSEDIQDQYQKIERKYHLLE